MNKICIIKKILAGRVGLPSRHFGLAFAPTNIALVKYWGKRDTELNLPVTASLSITLGSKGALTKITPYAGDKHLIFINGKELLNPEQVQGLCDFLDLFCQRKNNEEGHWIYSNAGIKDTKYKVDIEINIPVAAGLASSAAIYASIVLALDSLYGWNLDQTVLSILARLGSGSACRSIYPGFAKWHCGEQADGMDSFATPIKALWSDFRVGLLIFSKAPKPISSREAMRRTVETSGLYKQWSGQVARDMALVERAIFDRNFSLLGEIAENDAVMMHQTMADASPSINYSTAETLAAREKIQKMREQGVDVYFTQDAGSNLKLLFLADTSQKILDVFPDIEIIAPFSDPEIDQVILVDENDREIGVAEKIRAHQQAQLHRAFSVFIVRENDGLEILLQQRQSDKYHCGGLWTNSCCSHPRPGENILAAAVRRLHEELGIEANLLPIGNFVYKAEFANGLVENEFDHVLVGEMLSEDVEVNQQEVVSYKWVRLEELQRELARFPEKYTPWLEKALRVLIVSGFLPRNRLWVTSSRRSDVVQL